MSKEYAKLRKEVQRRKPTKLDKRKVQEHNRTAAPYYVIAESSYPSTAKSHRTPGTSGTTRQFTGNPSDPSTKTTIDKGQTASTGFKATTSLIPANSSSRTTGQETTTTTTADRRSTQEYSTTDLLTELISTIRDNLLENTVDAMPITTEDDAKSTTEQYPKDRTTTPKLTSTTILSFKGGTKPNNSTTITNIVTTTDCISASTSKNTLTSSKSDEEEEEAEASSTEFNIATNEITRTDYERITEDASSTETEEQSTLAVPSNDVTEVDLESKVNVNAIAASKISPDLEHLLNITISKNEDYGEYDYNEPTLPPSLPNLQ